MFKAIMTFLNGLTTLVLVGIMIVFLWLVIVLSFQVGKIYYWATYKREVTIQVEPVIIEVPVCKELQ